MVALIGDFALRCGGEQVDVTPSSQRLICFLALRPPHPVRRMFVSGTLWPDSDEVKASANLRSALWRIPAPGGSAVVCASATHVWLHPDVQVDLRQVARSAMDVIDGHVDNAQLVNVAREVCSIDDDVLVGWYDDWVITERERFRQLRLHALDYLGEQLLAEGRYYDALRVGLVAVSAEPLWESGHRLIMRTHLAEGNIAEAIHRYQSYASLLAAELGARPSSAMEALRSESFASAAGRR
ncbi:MAG TPA: BTAD domain-containing putative transcriptional regulator [Jiangellaceae bacterium]|nr:BTAD domain-containing putative transcriptional regulator [Jiangellaceae bacterium]